MGGMGSFTGAPAVHRAEVMLNAVALANYLARNGERAARVAKSSPAYLGACVDVPFYRLFGGHDFCHTTLLVLSATSSVGKAGACRRSKDSISVMPAWSSPTACASEA